MYATNYVDPRQSVYACPGYNRVRGLFSSNSGLAATSVSFGSYAYNSHSWANAWDHVNFGPYPRELLSQGLGGIVTVPPDNLAPTVWRAVPENKVASPNDMIAFGDAPFASLQWLGPQARPLPAGFIDFSQAFSAAYPSFYTDAATSRLMAQRHGGRWNVGFCDGHVENLRTKDLFGFSNPNVARRWSSDHQPHNEQWHQP